MSEENIDFIKALDKDVSMLVEKRKSGSSQLSYLSWASAWMEFVKLYPGAEYEVVMHPDENGVMKPFTHDKELGYMVYTKVKVCKKEHMMWLPVMNGANKAMKSSAYTYTVKDWKTKEDVEKPVEQATMFDVNKAIMRCLVKNLAMFGLGLGLYQGEDLPSLSEEDLIAVDRDKKVKFEKSLDECKSLEDLSELWRVIPVKIQKDLMEKKDELKDRFSGGVSNG